MFSFRTYQVTLIPKYLGEGLRMHTKQKVGSQEIKDQHTSLMLKLYSSIEVGRKTLENYSTAQLA